MNNNYSHNTPSRMFFVAMQGGLFSFFCTYVQYVRPISKQNAMKETAPRHAPITMGMLMAFGEDLVWTVCCVRIVCVVGLCKKKDEILSEGETRKGRIRQD